MKNLTFFVLLVGSVASSQSRAAELFRTPLTQTAERTATGPYVGVASQFTRYGTLQDNGREINDSSDQRLNSSVTEVTLGYNFTRSFGVELDAPFIYREYQRSHRFEAEDDQTAGVGDISLLANWTAVRLGEGERFFGVKFSGGVKLPTGDDDRLKEETEEPREVTARVMTAPSTSVLVPQFVSEIRIVNGVPRVIRVFRGNRAVVQPAKFEDVTIAPARRDAIRGKDLALGSGSVDGILAANLYTRWHCFFLMADARYTIRSEGAYDYRYANDFQWSGGPGLYAVDGPDVRVAIQLICSGEVKGEDEFQGHERNDTELTAVFLGPSITAAWKDRFSAQIGAELPVHIGNSGYQVVPDFRIQTSFSWQF